MCKVTIQFISSSCVISLYCIKIASLKLRLNNAIGEKGNDCLDEIECCLRVLVGNIFRIILKKWMYVGVLCENANLHVEDFHFTVRLLVD